MSEHERLWTAHHEAAHAVATLRLRGEEHLGYATIVPRNDALGSVSTEDALDYSGTVDPQTGCLVPDQNEVDAQIIGKLAGHYGAMRAGEPLDQARECSRSDFEQAEYCLGFTKSSLADLMVAADRFVKKEWRAIQQVATELLARNTLDDIEISFAVDVADGRAGANTNLQEYRRRRDWPGPWTTVALCQSSQLQMGSEQSARTAPAMRKRGTR